MYEEELTYKIRGCVYEVYRTLGAGFLEVVYQNALIKELQLQGLRVNSEVPLKVLYKEQLVGEFRADLIVDNKVLLELKAQKEVPHAAEAQLINYLKVTGIKVGLLINFTHPKASIKRIIY
ncbi:GxxExxY protein [Aliidiomarina quisquiliarum]|uniref:GxxExxY protein n=1 Tax=Aliidiomarina quisquiliarum TaxID=2938947 RepID=UPI00208DDDCA|nr:GxxExxY protein [Aliidiomarina quisquiliarum]MCO4322429.1 GxxExxY protein [Aliidiomarina quisquiliarum]